MTVFRWTETNSETIARILPEAIVVMPTGAVELHGPHLPTGTDSILSAAVCDAAAYLAAKSSPRDFVLAPPGVPMGASNHHLPFGGTISPKPETLMAVLSDVMLSMHSAGARRLVIVNGHGGNVGICHAAAAAVAAHTDLEVAQLNYWMLTDGDANGDADADVGQDATHESTLVPGHACQFEASLIMAVRRELPAQPPLREVAPELPAGIGLDLHSARSSAAMVGYTNLPATASSKRGALWFEAIVTALSKRLLQ